VVGRRDAYWASGGSAVTNSLLLSAVWVVGAVFADRNTPALGGILNQQGVGNSTMWCIVSNTILVKLELWESVIVFNNIFWSATNLCLRYASAKCGR
jgi:hypothetical protein